MMEQQQQVMMMILERSTTTNDYDDKDKNKKKRRPNNRRPSKQQPNNSSSSSSGTLYSSNGTTTASSNNSSFSNLVAFTSLPPMHIHPPNGSLPISANHHFDPYWSPHLVNAAIQKGDVFVATLRVNAHNRLEAYCTIDGLPIDVLISGAAPQNRAVEGDVVAVQLDSLSLWTRLKGSAGHTKNCTPLDGLLGVADNCKLKEKLDDCNDDPNKTISSSSDPSTPIGKICALVSAFPSKRPTGRVVAIIQKSPRRDALVGFLGVTQWRPSGREGFQKETNQNKTFVSYSNQEFIELIPNDAKFPKMLVSLRDLPDYIKKRLMKSDAMELVAVRIENWREDSLLPHACVMHSFGRGGEIEPHLAAILFENSICVTEFSPESLSSLPKVLWEVPAEELERRKDLRNLCTVTIDPSTATDLDDALSVQRVSDSIFRIGVHIADVSYFVLPDTPLDIEAQTRSTSVYLRCRKLPMLPALLSENIGSLVPGVDRLAYSIMFDCNLAGDVVDRWIGRTVIRSCCKLSYQHAQYIIDGLMDVERRDTVVSQFPEVYGQFGKVDVIGSVKILTEISKRLKENRYRDGAVYLESSKPFCLFDEHGIPYDSMLSEQTESDFLVEEFMLLANKTAAEIISRAYPDCALLRRHPEPNARKLKEFEVFWLKHGLELDTSSSGQFNLSLGKVKEKLKNDPELYNILISYASRPMNSAAYFCTGDFRDRENEWAHYALAMPLYTHFTSPLRRYPDIVVQRTLSAAIEAEERYLQQQTAMPKCSKGEDIRRKCFSNLDFDTHSADSKECREALAATALSHRVPGMEKVAEIAAYCNERRQASRHAEDAGAKLYMWALLKKKETLIAEARVLGLGPKFMSIYIQKLAMERRIHYDDVDGMTVEWLEATSTLVLNLCANRRSLRKGSYCRFRPLEDVALVINSCDLEEELCMHDNNGKEVVMEVGSEGIVRKDDEPIDEPGISGINEVDPAAFPLTVRILSTINVALHAIGGGDGPLDIGARLYMCSYLR